jgi:transcription elongation factor Elf1
MSMKSATPRRGRVKVRRKHPEFIFTCYWCGKDHGLICEGPDLP